jgi:hypothetical protein
MRRQIRFSADPMLERLLDEALSYPSGEHGLAAVIDGPVIPVQVKTRLGGLLFLSATMEFESPADVTLRKSHSKNAPSGRQLHRPGCGRVRAETPERAV